MRRAVVLTFSSLILVPMQPPAAGAWPAREGPPPNVRPFFGAGYSLPVWYDDLERGYGLGAGFEIEHSSHASILLRFEWHRLHERDAAPSAYPAADYYDYGPQREYATALDWAVGARAYLPTGAIRPYAEACLGVRLAEATVDAEGVAFTLRLGVSSARPGGAGLFLDSGLNLATNDLNRYGIVPARIGIVFP